MNTTVTAPDGKPVFPEMGSYGIGVSRLVGAVIEASHDDAGIVWPDSIAPFRAAILNLKVGDAACDALCARLYEALGADALYDDRDDRAGVKFNDADLMGHPWQLVVGPRGAAAGKVELKRRVVGMSGGDRGGNQPRGRTRANLCQYRPAGLIAPMFGAFERAVAGRYLRARKGERFVSIIAIFSLVGIALGVATLIVVTSVMSGFQTEIVSRFLGVSNGDITIAAFAGQKIDNYAELTKRIQALHGVQSVVPFVDGQVLLSTTTNASSGGLVRGISQPDLKSLHRISDHILAGSLNDFTGDNALAIGVGFAESYRVNVGDPVTLISPEGAATAFGTIPRVRAYKVVAIFDAGLHDYNNSVVFLPLAAAQIYFQKPNAVTQIEIRTDDPDQVDQLMPQLAPLVSGLPVQVRDWRHPPTTCWSACCRCRRTPCSSCLA